MIEENEQVSCSKFKFINYVARFQVSGFKEQYLKTKILLQLFLLDQKLLLHFSKVTATTATFTASSTGFKLSLNLVRVVSASLIPNYNISIVSP